MKTFTRLGSFLMIVASLCWGSAFAQFTCDSPTEITCGETVFGATTGVTNDNTTSGAPTCITTVGTAGQNWYSFTAPAGGTVTMSLAGSDYDTKIHVYQGSCGALTCVAGNDDFAGLLSSQVTFTIVVGETYLVRVGGYTTSQGNFTFAVTCDLDTDGCTDPSACNFSTDAINDDGTCCFGACRTLTVGGGAFIGETEWQLLDAAGTLIVEGGGVAFNGPICVTPGCGFQFIMSDTFGDGWNNNFFTITDENGNVEATGTLLGGGGPETATIALGGFTSGCTDPGANNYDPNAVCDNGSCITCSGGTSFFTVNMFDSGNNGWGGATWTIVDANSGALVDTGELLGGSVGEYSQCLAPGCYSMITTDGGQPTQVSWEIVSISGTVVAEGGAGVNIGFPWGGSNCEILGCTDPGCNNYNVNANNDDGSCICPPSNDVCANATPIGCGVVVNGTTINATLDPTAVSCDDFIAITAPGVWYTFIGTGDLVNLSTCGSAGGDTKIHVFTGDCSSPICVTQNDDGCATGLLSNISFTAINGFAYYVLVSEFGTFGTGVDFELAVTCVNCENTPINDGCDTALPLPTGVDFPGNLCCANPDDDMGAWAGFGTEYGIWYVINSEDFSALDISFFNGTGQGPDAADGTDVGIGLFEGGAGCGDLTPLVGGVGFAGDLDGFIFNSLEFGLGLNANTNYYICVSTADPINCGDFVLNVTLANAGCTDAAACNYCADCTLDDGSCEYISCGAVTPNDLCSTATPLVCGVDVAGSTGAATNTGAPNVCPSGAGDIGVWYSFVGDGQFVNLSTCGSPIDSRITVVSSANGCAGPYTCVISEDDDATDAGCGFFNGDDASVGFVSVVGTQYYVYITAGGVDTNGDGVDDLTEGSFALSYTCEAVVQGCQDECACNYNAAANVDNGSCDFFSCAACPAGENAYRFDMIDTFGDGWNGNTYSITDLSGNVIAEGDLDNGQCTDGTDAGFDILCLADGCYNMTVGGGFFTGEIGWEISDAAGNTILSGVAPNGDGTFSFTIGAGVCGCTDATACNFDAAANSDDGSCEFTTCAGCTDAAACNFDATATISDAVQCCFENCVTLIMNDTFGDGWNGATASILDGSGNVIGTATLPAATSNGTAFFCLEDGCFTIIVGGGTFDNEINWTLTGISGGILNGQANDPAGVGFSTAGVSCIPGCTIPVACNYDPAATVGDCSLCDFSSCSGCTYQEAANYDAAAVVDDGSCDFSGAISDCPADLDGNGFVGVSDLLIFITAYGTICPN